MSTPGMKGGWSRGRRILKEWALLAGQLFLLHLLLFAGWVLLDPRPGRSLVPVLWLAAAYLVLFAIVLAVFCWRVGRAHVPTEYREAHSRGVSATATVLAVETTGWRSDRNLNFRLETRPRKYEYRIRLCVVRDGAPGYETETAEYLRPAQAPQVGQTVAVAVHPERPEVVVLMV
jgi:hypothetical protein